MANRSAKELLERLELSLPKTVRFSWIRWALGFVAVVASPGLAQVVHAHVAGPPASSFLLAEWNPDSDPRTSSSSIASFSPTAAVKSANVAVDAGASRADREYLSPAYQPRRPFENLAMAVKLSTNGFGIDFATPLTDHFSLRAGASFTKFNTGLTNSGLDIDGTLTLQGLIATVDIYPFRRSTFHISPGFNFSNDTHVVALLHAPPGATFSLGDGTYINDPTDPVHGVVRFRFGNRVAPRLTVGWGNMIPHGRGHWSVPFEVGVQYIAKPVVQLSMAGSVCDEDGCGTIVGDPNILEEQNELQNDLDGLRLFPVASIGISYRFGRGAGAH